METLDPGAGEFLRMAERYRQMSDDELLVLMPQSSELTPMAQQALASEVRQRGLKVESEKPSAPWLNPSAPSRFRPPDSFAHGDSERRDLPGQNSSFDEDRKLVELCTVWSVRDALKLQTILDDAGIPFFMGPEKATGVDTVTSDFAKGVSVQIMQVGIPWARGPMQNYFPVDDPTPKDKEEPEEIEVRCPKCHSTEVIFEGLTPEPATATDNSSQKYKWTCDSCGHQWEDDGVAKED